MPLQVRTISRTTEPGNLGDAVAEVEAETNAFLMTVEAVDVADIRVQTTPISKYGERICHVVTVIYLE